MATSKGEILKLGFGRDDDKDPCAKCGRSDACRNGCVGVTKEHGFGRWFHYNCVGDICRVGGDYDPDKFVSFCETELQTEIDRREAKNLLVDTYGRDSIMNYKEDRARIHEIVADLRERLDELEEWLRDNE